MTPTRRGLFARLSILAAALAGSRTAAAAAPGPIRVVYHLADADKVGFVLGNIANHLAGAGGAAAVTIELVVHGPALAFFRTGKASPDVAARLGRLAASGSVAPVACGNTMTAQGLAVDDLLPGFTVEPRGGVVRLAERQAEGWAYIRP